MISCQDLTLEREKRDDLNKRCENDQTEDNWQKFVKYALAGGEILTRVDLLYNSIYIHTEHFRW